MKRKNIFLFLTVTVVITMLIGCSEKTSFDINSKDKLSTATSPTSNTASSTPTLWNTKNTETPKVGAAAAKEDNALTKEKMLTYAMQDEYLAKKEYEIIMDKYGQQKPFSSIIDAEKNHISQLTALFKKYNIPIPEDTSKDYAVLPQSLNEAYKTGVAAEIENIAMYEKFLKESLPQDIKDTFIALRDASKNHLDAFQKNVK